jgi:hypothetical protein
MKHLGMANGARTRRAELKRQVREGEVPLLEALAHADAARVPAFEVVQWQYRWGLQRARRSFRALHLSETLLSGALSPGTREAVASECGTGELRVVSGFYSW